METPTEPEKLDRIYAAGDAAYRMAGEVPPRWNTMKDMRKAFGLPLGTDAIEEWLEFWDALNQSQRVQLRRNDLNKIDEWWDKPLPSTENKEK